MMNRLQPIITGVTEVRIRAGLPVGIRDRREPRRHPVVPVPKRAQDVGLRRHTSQRIVRLGGRHTVDRPADDAPQLVVLIGDRVVGERTIHARHPRRPHLT